MRVPRPPISSHNSHHISITLPVSFCTHSLNVALLAVQIRIRLLMSAFHASIEYSLANILHNSFDLSFFPLSTATPSQFLHATSPIGSPWISEIPLGSTEISDLLPLSVPPPNPRRRKDVNPMRKELTQDEKP